MNTLDIRRASMRIAAATIVGITALAWQASVYAQDPQQTTRTSIERGVTVKVTPKLTASTSSEREFAVVLDTHSEDLGDDLLKTAVLIVDNRELRPTSWTGAGPGGHHREGTLKFDVGQPDSSTIELRIQRAGETGARVFRWELPAVR